METLNSGHLESIKALRETLMAFEWELSGKRMAMQQCAGGARAHAGRSWPGNCGATFAARGPCLKRAATAAKSRLRAARARPQTRARALARRSGVANFEHFCAVQKLPIDYNAVTRLYEDPTDLGTIADATHRSLARSIIKQVGVWALVVGMVVAAAAVPSARAYVLACRPSTTAT